MYFHTHLLILSSMWLDCCIFTNISYFCSCTFLYMCHKIII